jgi:hypothetical protein
MAKHLKAGSGHCDTGEKRERGATRRKGMAWHCARHRAAFINQSGSLGRIHSLIPTCGDVGGQAFAGAWNPAIQVPRGELSANERGCNFEGVPCVALWQQPGGGRYQIRGTDQSLLATSDSATNYFLGALGRRRWRKRTPGPPPFSSMNSTPAASKARRTAKSLAVVIDVSSSVSSARLIVVTLRAVSRARSSALQRMSARAALI